MDQPANALDARRHIDDAGSLKVLVLATILGTWYLPGDYPISISRILACQVCALPG